MSGMFVFVETYKLLYDTTTLVVFAVGVKVNAPEADFRTFELMVALKSAVVIAEPF